MEISFLERVCFSRLNSINLDISFSIFLQKNSVSRKQNCFPPTLDIIEPVGVIFPSSLGLKNGDTIQAKQEGNLFILDTTQIAKEHDRKLIEESFQNFEKGLTVSEIEW